MHILLQRTHWTSITTPTLAAPLVKYEAKGGMTTSICQWNLKQSLVALSVDYQVPNYYNDIDQVPNYYNDIGQVPNYYNAYFHIQSLIEHGKRIFVNDEHKKRDLQVPVYSCDNPDHLTFQTHMKVFSTLWGKEEPRFIEFFNG